MGLFRRSKKKRSKRAPPMDGEAIDGDVDESAATAEEDEPRVGIVSEVLSPPGDPEQTGPFADVVERRFGPDAARPTTNGSGQRAAVEIVIADKLPPRRNSRPRVDNLLDDRLDGSDSLNLEIDAVALIGNGTTITGKIVSEEDLEIQGTVEGSIHLDNHRVTVGAEGIVNATVEAKSVEVVGKITGDVIATEVVEIQPGGVITGDVKAPRVIMNDGGIVVGGMDMSAALAGQAASDQAKSSAADPDRPKLIKVEPEERAEAEEGGA